MISYTGCDVVGRRSVKPIGGVIYDILRKKKYAESR